MHARCVTLCFSFARLGQKRPADAAAKAPPTRRTQHRRTTHLKEEPSRPSGARLVHSVPAESRTHFGSRAVGPVRYGLETGRRLPPRLEGRTMASELDGYKSCTRCFALVQRGVDMWDHNKWHAKLEA